MRKFFIYAFIFSLGFLVCLLALRSFGGDGPISGPEARRTALELLDRKPSGAPIQDNAIVLAASRIEPSVVNIDTLVTDGGDSNNVFNTRTGLRPAHPTMG